MQEKIDEKDIRKLLFFAKKQANYLQKQQKMHFKLEIVSFCDVSFEKTKQKKF